MVMTVGLTDPMKINRILQVLVAKGLQPTSVQVGGAYVNTWAVEGFPVSMAVIGNQAVIGIGRDGAGVGRIVMGQEQPSYRSQIRDPAIAQRFGAGGNGAFFVSLGPLMQQVGALDPDANRYAPATGMIDTIGGFYEQSGTGYQGEMSVRLIQGQTVANLFVTLVRIGQTAAPPTTPPIPAFPPGTVPPGAFPPGTVPPGVFPPGTVPPGAVFPQPGVR
jgi:hypothetical protein